MQLDTHLNTYLKNLKYYNQTFITNVIWVNNSVTQQTFSDVFPVPGTFRGPKDTVADKATVLLLWSSGSRVGRQNTNKAMLKIVSGKYYEGNSTR